MSLDQLDDQDVVDVQRPFTPEEIDEIEAEDWTNASTIHQLITTVRHLQAQVAEVPKGGFDGVLVTFGEGTDDDTWHTVFGGIAAGQYVVELSFRTEDGPDEEITAIVDTWTAHDGDEPEWQLQYRRWDDSEYSYPTYASPEPERRPLSQLVAVHVN